VANPKSCGNRRNAREFSQKNEQQTHERQKEWIWQFDDASQISANLANTDCTHGKGNQRAERTQQEYANANSPSKLAYTSELFSNGGNINRQGGSIPELGNSYGAYGQNDSWWKTEPNVGRVADGISARVDRLKAIGNAQVPLCAATAWQILSKDL
jgi:hypothetical protein